MTQAKKIKLSAFDMQEDWRKLNPQDQEIITNFFNVHNCAHLLFTLASENAKVYINNCIMMQAVLNEKDAETETRKETKVITFKEKKEV